MSSGPDILFPHTDDPEFVAAISHLRAIHRLLGDLGVNVVSVDEAPELGLAKVLVDRVPRPSGYDGSQVDWLLRNLRESSAASNGGWTPTIGKNRLVAGVVGGRVIMTKVGGAGGRVIMTGDALTPNVTPEPLTAARGGRGAGLTVGVLDGGVVDHPWFEGRMRARASTTRHSALRTAAEGHATFVAGLVLQHAPGASVIVQSILNDDGWTDVWTAARGMVALGSRGVDVLNLSFACLTSDGQPPLALRAAVDRLPQEVVVVAAAGNHAGPPSPEDLRNLPAWPAALERVTAVGCDASFSPRSDWVDLLAPGVDQVSTFGESVSGSGKFDGFASWSGTSFAAATVSGMVAAGAGVDGDAAQAAADLRSVARADSLEVPTLS